MGADRVPSGIPGLDELIGKGFPKQTVTLISGGPGSGKTIFALQMLITGAERYNEPGIYATMTETPEELRKDAASFGWKLEELEKKGEILFLDVRPSCFLELRSYERAETFFSWLWNNIRKGANEIGAKRIVIDSLNVLSTQFQDEYQARQAITSLVEALKKLPDCISFLLFEQIAMERTMEEFLTSGVIILHYVPIKNGMMRAIQVLKMRRTAHSENFHPFEIGPKGIKINPKETVVFF